MTKQLRVSPDVRLQGEGRLASPESHDKPSTGKSLRTKTVPGRQTTFQRLPVQGGRQHVAFTGRGFMPDYMTETGLTMMPEASRSTLENEGVYGKDGMMPPAGQLTKLQAGQQLDTGAGGAGSFATVTAFNAKVNG